MSYTPAYSSRLTRYRTRHRRPHRHPPHRRRGRRVLLSIGLAVGVISAILTVNIFLAMVLVTSYCTTSRYPVTLRAALTTSRSSPIYLRFVVGLLQPSGDYPASRGTRIQTQLPRQHTLVTLRSGRGVQTRLLRQHHSESFRRIRIQGRSGSRRSNSILFYSLTISNVHRDMLPHIEHPAQAQTSHPSSSPTLHPS